jgi:hypothetical protein
MDLQLRQLTTALVAVHEAVLATQLMVITSQ